MGSVPVSPLLNGLGLPGDMALLEYVVQITHTHIAASLTNRSFQARCSRNNQALVSTSPSRRAGPFDAPYHFQPSVVSLNRFPPISLADGCDLAIGPKTQPLKVTTILSRFRASFWAS